MAYGAKSSRRAGPIFRKTISTARGCTSSRRSDLASRARTVTRLHVPLIFSYGSLAQEAVQLATYGRVLHGEPDALVGWSLTAVDVPEWHKAAACGLTHYANVERGPESGASV